MGREVNVSNRTDNMCKKYDVLLLIIQANKVGDVLCLRGQIDR